MAYKQNVWIFMNSFISYMLYLLSFRLIKSSKWNISPKKLSHSDALNSSLISAIFGNDTHYNYTLLCKCFFAMKFQMQIAILINPPISDFYMKPSFFNISLNWIRSVLLISMFWMVIWYHMYKIQMYSWRIEHLLVEEFYIQKSTKNETVRFWEDENHSSYTLHFSSHAFYCHCLHEWMNDREY